MIVYCNAKCRSTSDASLDLDTNTVICNVCGEEVTGISSFSKIAMKNNGDIIKRKKRAFVFHCKTCDKMTEIDISSKKALGKDCKKKNCLIDVTNSMRHAMKMLDEKNNKERGEEKGDEA